MVQPQKKVSPIQGMILDLEEVEQQKPNTQMSHSMDNMPKQPAKEGEGDVPELEEDLD